MTKTIKFNLICDNNAIRTINDLQNNFSIEDVLSYYNSGLLERWLKVRGYEEELNKVKKITSETPIEIIKELVKIFDVECDEDKINKSIYILEYKDSENKLYEKYDSNKKNTIDVIEEYKNVYNKLINDIESDPNNMSKIKACINEMVECCSWILELNHRELFYELKEKSILAIMCFLMNEKSRKYYLPDENEREIIAKYVDIEDSIKADFEDDIYDEIDELITNIISGENSIYFYYNRQKEDMKSRILDKHNLCTNKTKKYIKENYKFNYEMSNYNITDRMDEEVLNNIKNSKASIIKIIEKKLMFDEICNIINNKDFKTKLGDNIKSFSGETDSYWKDLEDKEKKYMIISIGMNDKVRSSGMRDGDMSYTDVKNNFVIIDGIDYMSNNLQNEILYMEV